MSALPQKEGGDLEVVVLRREKERAPTLIGSRVDLGPGLQQEADGSRVAFRGRDDEGRDSILGW